MGNKPRMFRPRFTTVDRPREFRTSQNKPRSSTQMGYDRHWRRFRLAYLNDNPLCVRCEASGRVVAATIVDHIVPLTQGGERLVTSNVQSLCKHHHDLKTATEDGGVGNRKHTQERT